jgi:hypothetical protein
MPTEGNARTYLMPDEFLRQSKNKTISVVNKSPYVDGNTSTYELPSNGLLQDLWVLVQGTITVAGTITSGTFQSYPEPVPYGIINRMRLGSNNAFSVRDLSGTSWYLWSRNRYCLDQKTHNNDVSLSANTAAALGLTSTKAMIPGGNVEAGTYDFAIMLPLPIAYNRRGEIGMLVLQQNSTKYSLKIDWGRVTTGITATGGTNSLFKSLVGTGISVTADIKISVGMDYWDIVPGVERMLSMFMSVNDQMFNGLKSGENLFAPPANDYYTTIMLQLMAGGSPVPVSDILKSEFIHSGNLTDYSDDYPIMLMRDYFTHGGTPSVDGVISYDLGIRKGIASARDTFDSFNDMNVTDLKMRVTLGSGTSYTDSYARMIMETLRALRQI